MDRDILSLLERGEERRRDGQSEAALHDFEAAVEMARPLDLANALRSFALHAQQRGDREQARSLWEEARGLYLDADAVLQRLTGGNPGVAEADRRLAAL